MSCTALMAQADHMMNAWRLEHPDIAAVIESGHTVMLVEPLIYDRWMKSMGWPRASEVLDDLWQAFHLDRRSATRMLLFTLAENRPWITFTEDPFTEDEPDFLANHRLGLRDAILGFCAASSLRGKAFKEARAIIDANPDIDLSSLKEAAESQMERFWTMVGDFLK